MSSPPPPFFPMLPTPSLPQAWLLGPELRELTADAANAALLAEAGGGSVILPQQQVRGAARQAGRGEGVVRALARCWWCWMLFLVHPSSPAAPRPPAQPREHGTV